MIGIHVVRKINRLEINPERLMRSEHVNIYFVVTLMGIESELERHNGRVEEKRAH